MHVFAVDDSEVLLEYTSCVLESEGHAVCRATSGEEALSVAASERFDLILSDFNMVGMDGFQLAAALRSGSANAETPIILITGEDSESLKTTSRRYGVNGWISKPFRPCQVIEIVQRFVS